MKALKMSAKRYIRDYMDKEQFKIFLLEQQIFDELKDGYFGGVGYIRNKYDGTGIDAARVYRRIVNYRISTYGSSSLDNPYINTNNNAETRKKQSQYARQRRYNRRNYEKH